MIVGKQAWGAGPACGRRGKGGREERGEGRAKAREERGEENILGDEGVNLAKVGNDLVDEPLDVLVVADVALVGLGLDTVLGLELLDVLLGTLGAGSVGDGDAGTHLSSTTGSLNTHTAGSGSAGDDDDLALEAEKVLEVGSLGDWDRHLVGVSL